MAVPNFGEFRGGKFWTFWGLASPGLCHLLGVASLGLGWVASSQLFFTTFPDSDSGKFKDGKKDKTPCMYTEQGV